MARIDLDKAARETLARLLVRRLKDEMDIEVEPMDGQRLLDLFCETAGAFYYNQGLHDARAAVEDRAAALAEAIDGLERAAPR
jgi:uncharacterized protein (DUF2164 family)